MHYLLLLDVSFRFSHVVHPVISKAAVGEILIGSSEDAKL